MLSLHFESVVQVTIKNQNNDRSNQTDELMSGLWECTKTLGSSLLSKQKQEKIRQKVGDLVDLGHSGLCQDRRGDGSLPIEEREEVGQVSLGCSREKVEPLCLEHMLRIYDAHEQRQI